MRIRCLPAFVSVDVSKLDQNAPPLDVMKTIGADFDRVIAATLNDHGFQVSDLLQVLPLPMHRSPLSELAWGMLLVCWSSDEPEPTPAAAESYKSPLDDMLRQSPPPFIDADSDVIDGSFTIEPDSVEQQEAAAEIREVPRDQLAEFKDRLAEQAGISEAERADLDVGSSHPYSCKCEICKRYWLSIGPDPDTRRYGAFTPEEMGTTQAAIDAMISGSEGE